MDKTKRTRLTAMNKYDCFFRKFKNNNAEQSDEIENIGQVLYHKMLIEQTWNNRCPVTKELLVDNIKRAKKTLCGISKPLPTKPLEKLIKAEQRING